MPVADWTQLRFERRQGKVSALTLPPTIIASSTSWSSGASRIGFQPSCVTAYRAGAQAAAGAGGGRGRLASIEGVHRRGDDAIVEAPLGAGEAVVTEIDGSKGDAVRRIAPVDVTSFDQGRDLLGEFLIGKGLRQFLLRRLSTANSRRLSRYASKHAAKLRENARAFCRVWHGPPSTMTFRVMAGRV